MTVFQNIGLINITGVYEDPSIASDDVLLHCAAHAERSLTCLLKDLGEQTGPEGDFELMVKYAKDVVAVRKEFKAFTAELDRRTA